MRHSDLLCQVFWDAITLGQTSLTEICLEGLEHWILIGWPLLTYTTMV
jgi:hypothetical protein